MNATDLNVDLSIAGLFNNPRAFAIYRVIAPHIDADLQNELARRYNESNLFEREMRKAMKDESDKILETMRNSAARIGDALIIFCAVVSVLISDKIDLDNPTVEDITDIHATIINAATLLGYFNAGLHIEKIKLSAITALNDPELKQYARSATKSHKNSMWQAAVMLNAEQIARTVTSGSHLLGVVVEESSQSAMRSGVTRLIMSGYDENIKV